MNTLLIFFAFPLATIIISAVLQRLLKSPFIVATLIFAIFLIVTFAAFDETFLIATLVYTIIAFITALLVNILSENNCNNHSDDNENERLCKALLDLLENISDNNDNNTDSCSTLANLINNVNNDDTAETANTGSCGCGCNRSRLKRF